jgi:hypothetical protein
MNQYIHEKELKPSSVEHWCRQQVGWLEESVKACEKDEEWKDKINQYIRLYSTDVLDRLHNDAALILLRLLGKTPLAVEMEAIIMCASHIDRPAIGVMIICLLWYEAKLRNDYLIYREDVEHLFFGKTTPDQWKDAWESQKFVTKDKRLDNMLDWDLCFQSLFFEGKERKADPGAGPKLRTMYFSPNFGYEKEEDGFNFTFK